MTPKDDAARELRNSIDESLDEWGFAHRPGSIKGRMSSARFNLPELRRLILKYIADECRRARLDERSISHSMILSEDPRLRLKSCEPYTPLTNQPSQGETAE